MNIDNEDIVMRHCPHCDSICLVSKTDIDSARAANKLVCISCHQCQKQFAIDGGKSKDRKIARPADLKLVICPSCKKQVTLPSPLPDRSTVDLFCPFCDGELDNNVQKAKGKLSHSESANPDLEKAGLNPARQAIPSSKSASNYMPLYVLAVFCLGAYLFWAHETGQFPAVALPFDQWFKILE